LVIPVLYGCGGQATIPEVVEPGVLSPGQIDSSMLDQLVKIRGKVLWVIPNPGGLGGLYLKLGNGEGEAGVRIQNTIWKTLKVPPVFPLIRLPSPIGPVPFVLSPL